MNVAYRPIALSVKCFHHKRCSYAVRVVTLELQHLLTVRLPIAYIGYITGRSTKYKEQEFSILCSNLRLFFCCEIVTVFFFSFFVYVVVDCNL